MRLPRRYFRTPRIERQSERRPDAAWLRSRMAAPDALLLPLSEGRLAIRRQAQGAMLGWIAATEVPAGSDHLIFLGERSGAACFAISLPPEDVPALAARHGFELVDLRLAASLLDHDSTGLAAYARALEQWQRSHRFCPACGTATRFDQGGFRSYCTPCGRENFPRLDPAIIVAVTFEDRLLLGRQPGWPTGQYSVLAGFVEPGETLEAAVRREVFEEAGVGVGAVSYRGSQPWPFPASLMVGFRGTASSERIRCGEELEDVRWFDVPAIRQAVSSGRMRLSSQLSISRYLIDEWIHEMTGEDSHHWGEQRT